MAKITLKNARASAPPKSAASVPATSAISAPSLSRAKATPPPDFTKPVSALAKLKQSADILNAITDTASDSVKSIEEFLSKECSIGFHSYVCVRSPGEETPESVFLEYRRIGNKFRIAVVEVDALEPDREYLRAWSDCPRNLKMETIEKLPELIDKITEQVELEIVSANDAMHTVNDVLKSLTGNEG